MEVQMYQRTRNSLKCPFENWLSCRGLAWVRSPAVVPKGTRKPRDSQFTERNQRFKNQSFYQWLTLAFWPGWYLGEGCSPEHNVSTSRSDGILQRDRHFAADGILMKDSVSRRECLLP